MFSEYTTLTAAVIATAAGLTAALTPIIAGAITYINNTIATIL